MKKLSLSVLLLLGVLSAFSQEEPGNSYIAKPRVNIGAELALPFNTGYGNIFSTGLGATAKFEIPVTRRFYADLSAGFTQFYLKERFANSTYNKNYVPLKAGAKYYFVPMYFLEAEVGASVGTNKGAGTAFAYAGGTGFAFPVVKDNYVELGARYEKWVREGGNIGFTGLRLAYKF